LVPRKEISDVPDLKVDVTAFRLIGAPEEERAAIMARLASSIGPDKSFQDILDATRRVRSYLNTRGYLLAQVYIPEQKLHDGVVEIAILLGVLGRVELNYDPATPVSKARIQAQLDRLQTGVVLRTAVLERVLFLLNDLHGGYAARSTIRPGNTPGTADLIVDVTPDTTVGGSLQLDTHGFAFHRLVPCDGRHQHRFAAGHRRFTVVSRHLRRRQRDQLRLGELRGTGGDPMAGDSVARTPTSTTNC
jgi:hemolysin activation/secretion protein